MTDITDTCPRFKTCEVNNCPLHSVYPNLSMCSLDFETRCSLGKGSRLKLVSKYLEFAAKLKFGGLTLREFSSKQYYDSLSEEQIDVNRKRAKNAREVKTLGKDIR